MSDWLLKQQVITNAHKTRTNTECVKRNTVIWKYMIICDHKWCFQTIIVLFDKFRFKSARRLTPLTLLWEKSVKVSLRHLTWSMTRFIQSLFDNVEGFNVGIKVYDRHNPIFGEVCFFRDWRMFEVLEVTLQLLRHFRWEYQRKEIRSMWTVTIRGSIFSHRTSFWSR